MVNVTKQTSAQAGLQRELPSHEAVRKPTVCFHSFASRTFSEESMLAFLLGHGQRFLVSLHWVSIHISFSQNVLALAAFSCPSCFPACLIQLSASLFVTLRSAVPPIHFLSPMCLLEICHVSPQLILSTSELELIICLLPPPTQNALTFLFLINFVSVWKRQIATTITATA